jgi:chaperonin GroES
MTADKIIKLASSINIADDLSESELKEIGEKVIKEAELDKQSMEPWLDRIKNAMDIAMQIVEKKNFPWEGAANVKFPLITNGAITFASREYPQIVRGNQVVGAAIFGKDTDGSKKRRAERISNFMSWQLLVDSDDWEADTDKLLVMLAVIGTVFRKSYHNPILSKPITEVCRPDQIIINNNVKSLETARRISHRIFFYINDIVEMMRLGYFTEHDIKCFDEINGLDNSEIQINDPDRPHELIEQHRYLDLDGDGYQEPYIVTVHAASKKVLRIVARFDLQGVEYTNENKIKFIRPIHYFTDFHFLPSPDGKFLSLGLGTLLDPLNRSINSLINQLLNSGTLLNAQPVIIGSGARIKASEFTLAPGTMNKVEGMGGKLTDNIMPLPLTPPSPVLFQLLGLMIDVGKELASITDILQGKQPTQNSPATTVLSLIKQGLVQYNAIHKRVLRSFKKEFQKLYRLNHDYLDINKYLAMIDDPEASEKDFDLEDLDIRTVSDPNMASDVQRLAKAQSVYQMPEVDRRAAAEYLLDSLDVEDYEMEMLLPPIDPQAPPPPEVQKILAEAEFKKAETQSVMLDHRAKAADLELSQKKLEISMQDLRRKYEETLATNEMLRAQATKMLADAYKAKKDADRPEVKPNG